MVKKIIGIVLLIVLCGALFAACKEPGEEPKETEDYIDYHAELLFSFNEQTVDSFTQKTNLKESFVQSNSTYGAVLRVEEGKLVVDKTSPEYRGYIIKDKKGMEECFITPPEVDFETQMIVIVFFTSSDMSRCSFGNFEEDGENLKLTIKRSAYPGKNSSAPWYYQSVWGFLMDKLDLANLEMEYIPES